MWSPHTAAGEDVGLCRVDGDAADVVSVSLEHVNSLQSVVVEHTDQHVILGNGHRDRETTMQSHRCIWLRTLPLKSIPA